MSQPASRRPAATLPLMRKAASWSRSAGIDRIQACGAMSSAPWQVPLRSSCPEPQLCGDRSRTTRHCRSGLDTKCPIQAYACPTQHTMSNLACGGSSAHQRAPSTRKSSPRLIAWSRLVGMQQQSFATNGEPHASLRRTCPRRVGHENRQHLLRPRILRAEGQLRFTSLLCGTSAVTTATRWPRVV